MDRLGGLKDSPPAQVIAALLDGLAFDQIHLAAEDGLQLPLHPNHVEQAARFRPELDENVDVTVRAESVPQDRAEQRPIAVYRSAWTKPLVIG